MQAVTQGEINPGDVVVIRNEGPAGGPGMREMLAVTAAIVGEGLGEMALLALGLADPGGKGLQLLQCVDAEPAEPGDQAVQHVDRRAGVTVAESQSLPRCVAAATST